MKRRKTEDFDERHRKDTKTWVSKGNIDINTIVACNKEEKEPRNPPYPTQQEWRGSPSVQTPKEELVPSQVLPSVTSIMNTIATQEFLNAPVSLDLPPIATHSFSSLLPHTKSPTKPAQFAQQHAPFIENDGSEGEREKARDKEEEPANMSKSAQNAPKARNVGYFILDKQPEASQRIAYPGEARYVRPHPLVVRMRDKQLGEEFPSISGGTVTVSLEPVKLLTNNKTGKYLTQKLLMNGISSTTGVSCQLGIDGTAQLPLQIEGTTTGSTFRFKFKVDYRIEGERDQNSETPKGNVDMPICTKSLLCVLNPTNSSLGKRKPETFFHVIDDDKENLHNVMLMSPVKFEKNVGSPVLSLPLSPTEKLRTVYKKINQMTDLFFGVDKDIEDLPAKRRRTKSNMPVEKDITRDETPKSVSPGYGEISMGSFKKIVNYLTTQVADPYKMTSDSGFLDIGSGFGKCVLHAKIQGHVKRSVGIEYLKLRHEKAMEVLNYLQNQREDSQKYNVDLDGVHFIQADATGYEAGFPFDITHVYMYDYIFSEETHRKLIPVLKKTDFKVLICFSPLAKLKKYGLDDVVLINKLTAITTGHQNFTVYFYKKT